jgi:hypothetical protein
VGRGCAGAGLHFIVRTTTPRRQGVRGDLRRYPAAAACRGPRGSWAGGATGAATMRARSAVFEQAAGGPPRSDHRPCGSTGRRVRALQEREGAGALRGRRRRLPAFVTGRLAVERLGAMGVRSRHGLPAGGATQGRGHRRGTTT